MSHSRTEKLTHPSGDSRSHGRRHPLLFACSNGSTSKDSKDLWIANRTDVVEYTPSQLNQGSLFGGPTSSASGPHLTLDSAFFGAPRGVSFDSSGNLWVVDPIASVNGGSAPALIESAPRSCPR